MYEPLTQELLMLLCARASSKIEPVEIRKTQISGSVLQENAI